ncbi:SDR family oxidoreductase [Methylocapsa sp. S129]|uniref:SDR family oxidoreductase n=1 Tax=Methylocapsa sp. S129 TaxID=1641869 RepID=UPI00131D64ED|nr:SDR family oxidoreductase [Methylocapsa sp. S129]
MDLGIRGRTAIICASSRGLGRACAEALAREGVNVVINGRDAARIKKTAAEISETAQAQVQAVVGDVTTAEGRAALLAIAPTPDILVNNNAGPSPHAFDDITGDMWMEAVAANMVAPLLLARAVLPAMIERKFGRIVNITSAMVTTPRPHMALSSGARAGLTAAMKGLSLDVAKSNVTINNLLPERFDTDRQEQMARVTMQRESIGYEEARRRQVQSIAARRLGRPEEFGAMCAFLCSVHAGFVSGQNIHLDGGTYPALM